MPYDLLVAGLDGRSLLLEAPLLNREGHLVEQRASIRQVLQELPGSGARLVVLGSQLPDLPLAEAVRRIRNHAATRHVSILALIPAGDPPGVEDDAIAAGANAALRRPLERDDLESWLAKLLAVPVRVQVRIPVQGQVVGTQRANDPVHFYGLTRNLSVNGVLLASPIRLPQTDLDLEMQLPGVAVRVQALGRVVREAEEVDWPYLGYGVEFLFVPPESADIIQGLVVGAVVTPAASPSYLIHSTVRRADFVYEILLPVQRHASWLAEIRRGPRDRWRPGVSGPFYVVEGASREAVLREAREFVMRHGEGVGLE
jgi:CheY-like chemotaxis protein